MYFPYEKVTPGIKAETFDELMEGMRQVFSGTDMFAEDRQRVRNLFYCEKGQKSVGEELLEKMKLL